MIGCMQLLSELVPFGKERCNIILVDIVWTCQQDVM